MTPSHEELLAARIRLAEDRAFTLEFCRCGKHPRLLSVAALMWSWRLAKLAREAGRP